MSDSQRYKAMLEVDDPQPGDELEWVELHYEERSTGMRVVSAKGHFHAKNALLAIRTIAFLFSQQIRQVKGTEGRRMADEDLIQEGDGEILDDIARPILHPLFLDLLLWEMM